MVIASGSHVTSLNIGDSGAMAKKKFPRRPSIRCDHCKRVFPNRGQLSSHWESAHGVAAKKEERSIKQGEDAHREQKKRMIRIVNEVMLGDDPEKLETYAGTQVLTTSVPPSDITHASRRGKRS